MKKTNLIGFQLVLDKDFTVNDCYNLRGNVLKNCVLCLRPDFIDNFLRKQGISNYKVLYTDAERSFATDIMGNPIIKVRFFDYETAIAEFVVETDEPVAQEQMQKQNEELIRSGFEAAEGEKSFYYEELGKIAEAKLNEHTAKFVENLLVSANYYSDKKVAEWCIRHNILQRQMRRCASVNNSPFWRESSEVGYYINYGLNERGFFVSRVESYSTQEFLPDKILFENMEDAKNFYCENYEEFIWLANNKPDRF